MLIKKTNVKQVAQTFRALKEGNFPELSFPPALSPDIIVQILGPHRYSSGMNLPRELLDAALAIADAIVNLDLRTGRKPQLVSALCLVRTKCIYFPI